MQLGEMQHFNNTPLGEMQSGEMQLFPNIELSCISPDCISPSGVVLKCCISPSCISPSCYSPGCISTSRSELLIEKLKELKKYLLLLYVNIPFLILVQTIN
ncbi:hypothetical protein LY90DRAFT_509507 [Neocallimastix californiae]|uniref:Uncharacterized protein n=1 Tax=Neocallimastix californiae TaxID=1754190 RepID=A0A1Y2CED4_9FUNG|nr:hypothetical protein LY90DRAFT_509507 [Neocallimastix californiae]|eukprot:ORY45421.1 hypothetical protein LY90DRAFT_509507 [Neocallimastix californiae]